MSLPLRLAIMFTPVLVRGALYLASQLSGISPPRFTPWLRTGFVVLMGVSLLLFVLDHTRASNIVAIHAWGLFGAELWIARRYKPEKSEPLLTSLKL